MKFHKILIFLYKLSLKATYQVFHLYDILMNSRKKRVIKLSKKMVEKKILNLICINGVAAQTLIHYLTIQKIP